ncbi:MAG: hypothetical protein ACFFD5_17020 [Candidatus Thorarchaeota archaeon]
MTESFLKEGIILDDFIKCAFYEKCTLPKRNTLCDHFPDYTFCTEFQAKRIKLILQK